MWRVNERGRGKKKALLVLQDFNLRPYVLVRFDFLDCRYLKILHDDPVPRIRFKKPSARISSG